MVKPEPDDDQLKAELERLCDDLNARLSSPEQVVHLQRESGAAIVNNIAEPVPHETLKIQKLTSEELAVVESELDNGLSGLTDEQLAKCAMALKAAVDAHLLEMARRLKGPERPKR